MEIKIELISIGKDGKSVKTDIPVFQHQPIESSYFGSSCVMHRTEFLQPVTVTNKDAINMEWVL